MPVKTIDKMKEFLDIGVNVASIIDRDDLSLLIDIALAVNGKFDHPAVDKARLAGLFGPYNGTDKVVYGFCHYCGFKGVKIEKQDAVKNVCECGRHVYFSERATSHLVNKG